MVVIAGATGNLGFRIATELIKRQAKVRALVRAGTSPEKVAHLRALGIEVMEVDFNSVEALTKACEGGAVVLSALSGLRDVIVDTQLRLIVSAMKAKVPRFIPSDFSIDFTKLPEGSNRNLDIRREFMRAIEPMKGIKVTSILNGAYTDMLSGQAPFIMYDRNKVLCWGNCEQLMEWTTMDNTAAYVAQAALDPNTPRFLHIAGDRISAEGMAAFMRELTSKRFKVFRPGGLKLFSVVIAVAKLVNPGSKDLYPVWQGMQYMRNMFSGFANAETLDNDRYPVQWTTTREFVAKYLESKK